MSIFSIALLAIFGISIVIVYLTVRRTPIRVSQAIISGSLVDVITLFLFSLSSGNDLVRALIVGVVMGILFNALAVSAAAYFRQNDSARKAS